jgi:hypothetical protein
LLQYRGGGFLSPSLAGGEVEIELDVAHDDITDEGGVKGIHKTRRFHRMVKSALTVKGRLSER